jgi:predicted Zn finger-like uncharacterized protein
MLRGRSMIVQCEKCKTKFRIADEKLTDTGVKVRCSRCAHVFVVRTGGQVASPPSRGPDTARVDTAALASLAASTQGSDPDLPSWTGFPSRSTEQSAIPGLLGPRPSALPSIPPAATSSQQLAAALGFGGAPPPPPPPLPPTPAIPDFSEARTIQTKLSNLPKPAASDANLPSFPGPNASPKTPSGARPVPMAIPKAVTDPDPSVRFPPPPDLLASLARDEDAPEVGGAATEMNLHGLGDDFGAGFPPPPPTSDLGAPVLDGPSPALADDPFAGIDLDGPRSSPFHAAEGFDPNANKSTAANEILARIDLGKAAVAPEGADPFGQLEATAHAVDALPQRVTARPRAATVPSLPQLEHRVRRWPTLLGIAIGLGIALFVYPGLAPDLVRAFELRSLEPILSGAGATTLLPEGIAAVRAVDPIVTRYPADGSAGVLVVTGHAENASAQAYQGLDVVVLVLEGDTIKERQRAPLGLELSPGDLAKITSADDLQNAWAAALSKEPEGWKALAPGQERPFMVVFPRAAAGLESEAFRVEFTPPVVTSDGR